MDKNKALDILRQGRRGVAEEIGDEAEADAIFDKALGTVSDHIYTALYDGYSKQHFQAKIGEIEDWLVDGDLKDATIDGLIPEWQEYDAS